MFLKKRFEFWVDQVYLLRGGQSNPCTIKRVLPTTVLGWASGRVAGIVGAAGEGETSLRAEMGVLKFLKHVMLLSYWD